MMESVEAKIGSFQDVTGVEDPVICYDILQFHGWDLDAAVHSIVDVADTNIPSVGSISTDRFSDSICTRESGVYREGAYQNQGGGLGYLGSVLDRGREDHPSSIGRNPPQETMEYHGLRDPYVGNGELTYGHGGSSDPFAQNAELSHGQLSSNGHNGAWRDHQQEGGSRSRSRCSGVMSKIVSLPSNIVGGVSKAVGYGMSMAGGVLSHIGMGRRHGEAQRIPQQTVCIDPFLNLQNAGPRFPIQSDAVTFVTSFEQKYGRRHPSFVGLDFMEALKRAKDEYKFMFVYLHYPDHPHTDMFCEKTLCSEFVTQYLDANFVCWGASVISNEGFHMSNAFQATTFPFCALVTSASHESLAVLQQVEGPVSSEALIEILQRTVEEQGLAMMNERLNEEVGLLSNRQLKEEQDAAYQAALRADQEREHYVSKESQGKGKKKPAEKASPSQFRGKENAPAEKASPSQFHGKQNAPAEKVSSSQFHGKQNAPADVVEPNKGPNVTQIAIRFPNGDRKERKFLCTDKVQSIYKYVDSLGLVGVGSYKLITTFPRREYGPDKLNLTLKEAGLHPQASLFLDVSNKQ